MHTKVNNYSSAKNVFNCRNANKSYLLQKCKQKLSFAIVQTKVIFCNSASKSYLLQQCKQKLSLTGCAHKSYRSFDAILRFLWHKSWYADEMWTYEILILFSPLDFSVILYFWRQPFSRILAVILKFDIFWAEKKILF